MGEDAAESACHLGARSAGLGSGLSGPEKTEEGRGSGQDELEDKRCVARCVVFVTWICWGGGSGWMASTTLDHGAKLILLREHVHKTITFSLTLKVEQSCEIAVAAAVYFGTGKGQNDSFSPVFQGLQVSGGCG